MNNKRGQFFVLATLLILSAVTGIVLGANKFSAKDEQEEFYYFTEMFDKEFSKLLDSNYFSNNDGIINNLSKVLEYVNHSYPDTKMVIYFVNSTNISMVNSAEDTRSCMNFSEACGSGSCCRNSFGINSTRLPLEDVNISVGDLNFKYEFSKGSKSYIVFMREIDGDVYVDVKE